MIEFELEHWSAWAPGLETRESWLAWARAPRIGATDGAPEVRFIPAMTRRRLSRIAKMVAQVAHDCSSADELRERPLVFASRHCEIGTSTLILRDIAANLPLSPTAFSHSVHNAPVGQLSILAQNRRPSVSVSARQATFAMGWLEALSVSRRCNGSAVLYVYADEPLPVEYRAFADEPDFTCATALVVRAARGAADASFTLRWSRAEPSPRAPDQLPDPLATVAWLCSRGAQLDLAAAAGWGWRVEHRGR